MSSPKKHLVTAWAQSYSGPGWANQLVNVLWLDPATGVYEIEAIQPSDQTPAMAHLFPVAAAASAALTRAVRAR